MSDTELAELLLARLYELANAEGRFKLHRLGTIAAGFGATDKAKVFSVANALERRGLISASFTHDTEVIASITSEGAFLVEGGGQTGIIRQHSEHPENAVVDQSIHFHGPVTKANVLAHSPGAVQISLEIASIFQKLREAVDADGSLTPTQKAKVWSDLELIRTEILRENPRGPILREALATVADVASLASLAWQLASAIGIR